MINLFSKIQNTKENIDFSTTTWENKDFKFPNKVIRLGTVFSGIGAVEHALKRIGINYIIQFAGDIDNDCKTSYFANYDITESKWHSDIHNFNAKPYLGSIDLLVGGAPCQSFSIRGKRKGIRDDRGTLFYEFARIINECKPKIFIFENVKGILSQDKGQVWEIIKNTFENECNYKVYYQVLNGKDYGIPQSRERVFCIGFKDDTYFKYPAPIPLKKTMYDFLDKEFNSKYILKEKGVNFITRTINHNKSYTQVNGDIMLCQKRNQQFNWHGDFVFHPINNQLKNIDKKYVFNAYDFEEQYYINKNTYKYTVCQINDDSFRFCNNIEDFKDYHFGIFRKLTPTECLSLMGFDKSFKICVSDATMYKQAGNSIIVNILIALLKQLDISKYGI